MTEPRTFTFQHPELGSLTGLVQPDDVVQFRAIPYATVPGRFKRSILRENLPEDKDTYTTYGYASPQIFPPRDADGGPFPNDPAVPPSDEFNCLILQLNVPLTVLQAPDAQKLPILIYIHGGGFVLGRIDDQHSTALMVHQSVVDNTPLIAASIQYRLGALGYLQTPEPGNANLALHDQRNALRWIQKFVGGFGGDRSRVTVFGESAGSMSIVAHLLAPKPEEGPLFTRAVMMSGPIGPASAPVPVAHAQERYEAFLGKLGISERGEEGLRKAREADVKDVVAASAALGEEGGLWRSVQDEDFFGEDAKAISWDRVPELIGKCEWVNDIVLGSTGFEGTTFATRYKTLTPTAFLTSLTSTLGATATSRLATAYSLTHSMSQTAFLTPFLRWLGDVLFDAPTHTLAQHLSTVPGKNIYRYIFSARNPFPGHELFLHPHHWVDIYYVFMVHQFRFPPGGEGERLKRISTQHARFWIGFARGEAPWGAYRRGEGEGEGKERMMRVNEEEGWTEMGRDEVRVKEGWGFERCEELVKAWGEAGWEGEVVSPLGLECLSGVRQT